jgi:hypothetical protein
VLSQACIKFLPVEETRCVEETGGEIGAGESDSGRVGVTWDEKGLALLYELG